MTTKARQFPRTALVVGSLRIVRSYAAALVYGVLLALFVRTWLFQAYIVPSDSMAPTLQPGDRLLVNKFGLRASAVSRLVPAWPIRRGDIVVLRDPRDPTQLLVKRSMGLPGEVIELRNRLLLVNGVAIDEPYLAATDSTAYPHSEFLDEALRSRDNLPEKAVDQSEIFVLGDHRDVSIDSRQFGAADQRDIVGRAWLIYRRPTPRAPNPSLLRAQ